MRLSLIFLFFCSIVLFGNDEAEIFIAKLSESMKPTASLTANFVQKRTFPDVDMELITKGEFAIDGDGRMCWEIKEPLHCIAILTKEKLLQWDDQSNKKIELGAKDIPWLQLLYKQFSDWTLGNITGMAKGYQVSKTGEYTLRFEPESTLQKEYVSMIELTFSDTLDSVKSILIQEKGGDTAVIEFSDIKLNSTIPEERWILPEK